MNATSKRRQAGASLIEILITLLILSLGMLALSGMMAYAVQMPKMSAYRAAAVSLASAHVERMRANVDGFKSDQYVQATTFPATSAPGGTNCTYPTCTAADIAAADKRDSGKAIFQQLPEGGMKVACDPAGCDTKQGDIWVMWREPSTYGSPNFDNSDECPGETFSSGKPRCVHIKFKL